MQDGTMRNTENRDIKEEYSLRRTLIVNILCLWQPEYKLLNGREIEVMGAKTPASPDSVTSRFGCLQGM
jgi:hypothetical protein